MNLDSNALMQHHLAVRTLGRRTWFPALSVLAIGLIVLGALFRTEATAALKVWQESTAYGHCFLVGPIAAWLAWERRRALAGLTPRPVPVLGVLALALAGVWFVAERLGLMEGRQFAVLFLAWLLIPTTLGFAVYRAMAVPLAYTVFLVPFGGFLVPALQDFTARFIGVGLTLLDVPHLVTATLIEIPEGTFRVAEACAGLRFLIAAIAFGALYACVIYRSAWRRLAFIAVCIVVPVIANGIRALAIVMLGHLEGSAEAGAVDHVLYGWIFFSVVILLLVLVGLPFREDSDPPDSAAIASTRPQPTPRLPELVPGALAVVAFAAAAAAGASWLDKQASAGLTAMAGQANRYAAALAVPPDCVASPAAEGQRRFVCGGVRLDSRVEVFTARAGPAVLRAWRDAAPHGPAEDFETSWRIEPGAHWRIVTTRDPGQTAASALWHDGAPAPDGMALRIGLARELLVPDDRVLVLAVFSAPSADTDTAARLLGLIAAQAGFPRGLGDAANP